MYKAGKLRFEEIITPPHPINLSHVLSPIFKFKCYTYKIHIRLSILKKIYTSFTCRTRDGLRVMQIVNMVMCLRQHRNKANIVLRFLYYTVIHLATPSKAGCNKMREPRVGV